MAEGLSTTASVIAVAACAAESAKFLFRAFHEAPMIPDHFRQLLSTLTSLHTTLSALQQCSANREAKLRFPRHFHQSLTECQRQLQVWSTKVAKIDAVLQSRKNKSHRSWQKIKWLAVGEKDTNRFLEIIKLYHAEFSLQLLALLLNLQDSNSALPILDVAHQDQDGRAESDKQRLSPNADTCMTSLLRKEFPPEEDVVQDQAYAGPSSVVLDENTQTPCKLDLPVGLLCKDPRGVQHHDNFKPEEKEKSLPEREGSGSERLCTTQHQIRTRTTLRFDMPFLNCVLRGGPVGMARKTGLQSRTVMLDSGNIGLGFSVCLGMTQLSSKWLSFEFMILFLSIFHKLTFSLFFNLDCVRVVPQDTSIFEAVRAGSTDRVRQLLASGQASVRDVTTHGLSLLHTASGLGLAGLARFLIQAGADINASDEDGDTPLHRATSRDNNDEVARILIENGADVASVAVGNRTALHSIFNDTIRYILSSPDVLEEIGRDSEDLGRGRKHDIVELWAADGFGRTCLHYAALKGNINLLSHLLEQASSLELESQDHRGMTSLHCATRSSRAVQVVKMLLAKGASVDARDASGHSLLDHAAIWGRKEALEQLLAP